MEIEDGVEVNHDDLLALPTDDNNKVVVFGDDGVYVQYGLNILVNIFVIWVVVVSAVWEFDKSVKLALWNS